VPLVFRRAAVGDVAAIVAMLADDTIGQSREDGRMPPNKRYQDAFAAIERDQNQLLVVVEQDGRIVGSLQLTFIPGLSRLGMWRGQIEGVRIASDHRGDGLGERMIRWAIETCRDHGCGLVQLSSDKRRPDAIRFYERLGFTASHEGMKLELAGSIPP
jgi:ribosomal protein S18 acetylase RimI-like enzyme